MAVEREIRPETTTFNTIDLYDLYGEIVPYAKKVPIPEADFWQASGACDVQFTNLFDFNQYVYGSKRKQLEISKACGFKGRGSLMGGSVGHFISESYIEGIIEWFPSKVERDFILTLASSLANGKLPLILDIACGSGFNTNLLAVNGLSRTIGIDPFLDVCGRERVPQVFHGAQVLQADFWDVYQKFSPEFKESIRDERFKIINKIKEATYTKGFIDNYSYEHSLAFTHDIKTLQTQCQEKTYDSQVDLALVSFMPRDLDLTIPVRDGVFPKAIIYVRPIDGSSGANDFYSSELEGTLLSKLLFLKKEYRDLFNSLPHQLLSFNPGQNYKTVARWKTHSYSAWESYHGKINSELEAEVIVQLRNDVSLGNGQAESQDFGFDLELERAFGDKKRFKSFKEGVLRAREKVFSSR